MGRRPHAAALFVSLACLATLAGMAVDASPDMEALVKGAWASAERLATVVVDHLPPLRDEVLRQLGEVFRGKAGGWRQ